MERLIRLTGESVTLLYDGDDRAPSACDQLGDALAKLREAAEYDAALSPLADALADGYAAVEDCARELKREAEEQEADPEELERIEERLQLFYKLKRKYGGSIEAVFRAPHDCFDYLCDARAREHELRIRTAARGEAGYGITAEELQRFSLSPAAISERFPSLSSDLLTVLQQVSDSIEALGKNFSPENKKS